MANKKETYTLKVDQAMDDVLTILTSCIFNNGLLPELVAWLKQDGRYDDWVRLMEQKSEGQHKFGWCKAEDCKWEQNHGKKS